MTEKNTSSPERLLEDYQQFLRRVVARLCPKHLGLQFEDIEQEARLRLWRAIKSEREIRDHASYLYRAAASATIDAVRRVKARREEQWSLSGGTERGDESDDSRHLAAASEEAPDRVAERHQILSLIRDSLQDLPDARRRAVALHLQGMTSVEVGEVLGWSEAKSRNLIYRGLKDLREKLRARGIAPSPGSTKQ